MSVLGIARHDTFAIEYHYRPSFFFLNFVGSLYFKKCFCTIRTDLNLCALSAFEAFISFVGFVPYNHLLVTEQVSNFAFPIPLINL